MADQAQLETALRNADAAGDADAARVLAAELVKMRAQPAQPRGVIDQLTGATGPRYQTWPERFGRDVLSSIASGAKLPGDVMAGQAQLPSSGAVPGSVPFGDPNSAGGRVADLALLAAPVNPAARIGDRAIPVMREAQGAYGEIQSVGPAAGATSYRPALPGAGTNAAVPPTITMGRETVQTPVLTTFSAKPKVPTTQELKAAGAKDIEAVKNSGLEIAPEAVKSFAETLERTIGVHPSNASSTFAILKDLKNVPAGKEGERVFVSASDLLAIREQLGHTAQNFNPLAGKDQLAASRAITALDKFISEVASKDVLAGTPATTAKTYERGRGNYAAAMRSNDITGVLDRAKTGILERSEGRAQAANSGRNIDNTIRQKVEAVLEKPKAVSGLTEAEIAALDAVVQGGKGRNSARYIGNLLGGGGGLGQFLVGAGGGATAGAIAGGPMGAGIGTAIGAAPVLTGALSKSIANMLAKRDLRGVDKLLRKRSPLYQERVANPGQQAVSGELRAAIIRALMMQQSQQQ
jgi:hypothetical protein